MVSLCWFPSPVFPPSEQQTCQAKQLGKALVVHMSFSQVQSRVVYKSYTLAFGSRTLKDEHEAQRKKNLCDASVVLAQGPNTTGRA